LDGDSGRGVDLALDGDQAHLAYFGEGYILKYATNATGEWVAEIIDNDGLTGTWPEIALDSNGHAHIIYVNYAVSRLRYATNASGAWVTSIIDDSGTTQGSTDIAVDGDDNLHICYKKDGQLYYSTNATGQWQSEVADDSSQYSTFLASIALDDDGHAYIGYNIDSSQLWYTTNAGGAWEATLVDRIEGAGQNPQMVLHDGALEFVYTAMGALVHATIELD